MQISKILKNDSKFVHPDAIQEAVGDSYLMKYNSALRQVRLLSLELGCKYVESWPEYRSFGLKELDNIVHFNQVPVVNNRKILEDIADKVKPKFEIADIPFPINNYHMHEASHCIAEALLKNAKTTTEREKILKSLVCESYANATEAFSISFINDPSHYELLMLNIYHEYNDEECKIRTACLEKLGHKNSFAITYFSYLYSNFLFESVSTSVLKKVVRYFGDGRKMNSEEIELAHRLFDYGFDLNLKFRVVTNRFYFEYSGLQLKGGLMKALDFDFLEFLKNNASWKAAIESLIASMTEDLKDIPKSHITPIKIQKMKRARSTANMDL